MNVSKEFLFVCVAVLGHRQPNGAMLSAVNLPNHTFTGAGLVLLAVNQYWAHSDNCSSWISKKQRMTVEIVHDLYPRKNIARSGRGGTRNLLITSRTRIQLKHRGWLYKELRYKSTRYKELRYKSTRYKELRYKSTRYKWRNNAAVALGPGVQSVVSLTSSLMVISLTVLADSVRNILIFFAEKMWVAFAVQKLLTFFQQKMSAYLRITRLKF